MSSAKTWGCCHGIYCARCALSSCTVALDLSTSSEHNREQTSIAVTSPNISIALCTFILGSSILLELHTFPNWWSAPNKQI